MVVVVVVVVSVKWLAVKTASEMTYTVSSGALNSTPTPTVSWRCRLTQLTCIMSVKRVVVGWDLREYITYTSLCCIVSQQFRCSLSWYCQLLCYLFQNSALCCMQQCCVMYNNSYFYIESIKGTCVVITCDNSVTCFYCTTVLITAARIIVCTAESVQQSGVRPSVCLSCRWESGLPRGAIKRFCNFLP